MSRKIITALGTLGIIAAFFGVVAVMGVMRPTIEKREYTPAPPTVFFTTATARAVRLVVTAQGEVRPRTDITLTTEVAGKIVETAPAFVNGGAFEKGDLLVRIEDADFRAAEASARARVAQAEEALRREEAEAALAARDYADLGPDDAPNDLALRKPQLAQARANYQAALADLNSAKLNVRRTRIRAPFKGRVRERTAGDGQFVSPGAQVGRIFSTDVAEVNLPLTDSDLAKLGVPLAFSETATQPGPPALLTANIAGAPHQWRGRIARTNGALDPATRQLSAIAVVDDPYGAGGDDGTPLAIGLFVTALIEGRPYDNAVVLPRSALHGRDIVYVISEDAVLDERNVVIVSDDKDTITVGAGLRPGDRVAISPLRGAGDGDKVNPVDPATPVSDNLSGEGQAIANATRSGGRP